jgi:hypothetical protein
VTPIEERYRSLLRILPAAYRADWEEEMVATFLAGMASDDPEDAEYVAEFGRPGLSEVASVVGLAVRLRLPALGYARTDRDRLMGDAVRIVALVGLLVNAATGAVAVGAHLWLIGKLPGFTQPDVWVGPLPGVVPMTRVLLVATALPAFAALIFGHRHAARLLASISLGTVMLTAVGDLIAGYPPMAGRWLAILLNLLIFAALCAHHGDAPPLPRRPWLLALPVAIGVALTMVVATASFRVTWWLVDWPAICCLLMALGLVAHMTTRRRPEWSVALAMLAGVVLLQRLVTLPEFAGSATAGQQPVVVWVGLAEIAAVVAAGLPVAWLARRVWRRLPAEAVPA